MLLYVSERLPRSRAPPLRPEGSAGLRASSRAPRLMTFYFFFRNRSEFRSIPGIVTELSWVRAEAPMVVAPLLSWVAGEGDLNPCQPGIGESERTVSGEGRGVVLDAGRSWTRATTPMTKGE